MAKRFAAFVLTHGRPRQQLTARSLEYAGYTGPLYYIIDNEDDTADEYRARYGDRVIQFDKKAIASTFDTADLSDDRRTIVYARNACFGIARELGLDYFVELDDDYRMFEYRKAEGKRLVPYPVRSMDAVCEAMLDFLDDTGAVCVAFSQGGDHFGGVSPHAPFAKRLTRKAMNSLFLRTDHPVTFLGRINEDVNTYVAWGSRGDLFLTVTRVDLVQSRTQRQGGGMTDVYQAEGTYVKSFYPVMMAPSCVKVAAMGESSPRIHHWVDWNRAVPKIVSDSYRKA